MYYIDKLDKKDTINYFFDLYGTSSLEKYYHRKYIF